MPWVHDPSGKIRPHGCGTRRDTIAFLHDAPLIIIVF